MKVSLHWLKDASGAKGKFPSLEKLMVQMPLAGFEIESAEAEGDDTLVDFAITPNRGDCLSVQGLLREIACLNQLPFSPQHPAAKNELGEEPGFYLTLSAKEACPFYAGRFIRNIPKGKKTPAFIQDRLRKSGVESIHPVVDICNYVMLLLGQPLHAFDAAKITSLEIRFAKEKESLSVLGGQKLNLHKNTLVIADDQGPQAVAGVIGGLDSSVTDSTENIFLESAHFTPEAIAGRARQYGLNTEASQRFERGVDPVLPLIALAQATEWILEYVGGEAGPLLSAGVIPPSPQKILLREARIQRILGAVFSPSEVENILSGLGMKVEALEKNAWHVTPPSYRFDVATEVDLIEELARVRGYNTIPTHLPRIEQLASPNLVADQFQTLRKVLTERGYLENINYSFIGEQLQESCFPEEEAVKLKNPLSAELAVMRTSLWPSLLSTWQYNANRQQTRARAFEIGRVYFPRYLEKEGHLEQPMMLAGLIAGSALPEQWGAKSTAVDFFDLKGDVETLMRALGWDVSFHQSEHAMLHPGQSADIYRHEVIKGKPVKKMMGSLGRLHPSLQQRFELKSPAFLFEFALESSFEKPVKRFQALSKFPSVRRDFAFLVKRDQAVGEILGFIQAHLGELCQKVVLFDVYEGKNLPADQKSIALGVVLQDVKETLSDDRVNALSEDLLAVLGQKFGLQLRGV